MTSRIALATAAEVPDLDDDAPALVAALTSRGVTAEPVVWTDPRVDYSRYDLVVVRSTWDYARRHDEFVAWADRVAAVTSLANGADVLRWNTHKGYLHELAEAGLPVVPTTWLDEGDSFRAPDAGEYVVKPAVSAGSRDTNRYVAGEHDDLASAHATSLLAAGRTVMIQPYLHHVDHHGETALLYFAGALSHAVRKAALLQPAMEPVATLYKDEEMSARAATDEQRAVADAVLEGLAATSLGIAPDELLYARVDLVPDHEGAPVLLELELTEPSMFLAYDGAGGAAAAGRFADAIVARLHR